MTSEINEPAQQSRPRPPFETIALVLQGGGALGAYQAGVYEGLAEAGLQPDWIGQCRDHRRESARGARRKATAVLATDHWLTCAMARADGKSLSHHLAIGDNAQNKRSVAEKHHSEQIFRPASNSMANTDFVF
jgi:hypothetical protein